MAGLALAFDVLAKDKASRVFDKVGDSADKAGKKGKGFGETFSKGMAVAVTAVAGLGAAAVAAFAGALDMGSANAKLSAQLGLSGEASARAGKMAGELYANNYGASLDEVNDAVRSVAQNITGTSAIGSKGMQDLTADVLSVSSAFDQDLAGTTAAVGQLMKTGLAKNSQEALDIITTGFQRGVNKADDLLDTFTEYSTVFRDIGISGKDATGLMSQGLKAGARDADTVADALKELAIRGQDGSKTSADGFKAIGLSADKMTAAFAKGGPAAREATDKVLDGLRGIEDPAKRNAAAVQLFGTKAEDLGDSLFALDLDTAATGLGKVDGAAKKVNDTLSNTPAGKIETFKRTLETTFTNVMGGQVIPLVERLADKVGEFVTDFKNGEGAAGQLRAGLEKVGGVIQNVTTWVSENQTVVKTLVAAILGGVAAFQVITGVVKAYTAVQAVLNVVMAANPIGIVVIAIAALAAGLIYAYQNSETFRSYVTTAFSMVKIGALTLAGVAVGAFQKMINFWFIVVGGLLDGAAKAFGWVPGIGPKLQGAATEFGKFRDSANAKLDAIQNDIQVNISTEQANIALEALHREFINKGWTVTAQVNTRMVYGGNGQLVPAARAHGGPVRAGGIYAVGDNPDGSWNATTELFVPSTSGRIVTQSQMRSQGTPFAASGSGRMHPADLAEMKAALREGAREGTAAGFGRQVQEAAWGAVS